MASSENGGWSGISGSPILDEHAVSTTLVDGRRGFREGRGFLCPSTAGRRNGVVYEYMNDWGGESSPPGEAG